jgi:putative ABC transport system substrate-binding protein
VKSAPKPRAQRVAWRCFSRPAAAWRAWSCWPRAFASERAQRARLHELLAATRLPAVFGQRDDALTGGLASFGPNFLGQYKHAARYVDAILRGADPADLPVEQPRDFELVLNARTARELGLAIAPRLRIRATKVIE